MPRRARFAPAGCVFHVVNRGNDRRQLFFEDSDYESFLRLLELGKRRHPVKVFGVCPIWNHFHALVCPLQEGALSAYFHWVQSCYSRDFRSHTRTQGYGHVFKERFWSGTIYDDFHFLNALRYIEGNPVAAKRVARAEDWRWSSLSLRREGTTRLLDPLPVTLPANWSERVNEAPFDEEPD